MANEAVTFDPTLMDALDEDVTPLDPDFDTDASAYDPPPPLPDGWHQATLSCVGVKDADGKLVPYRVRPWGNIPKTYHTAIQAKVVDPGGPQDGKYATDNTVTTHLDKRNNNTSKAASLYRGITGKPVPGSSEAQQMKALLEELQSSPLVYVKTQLEGQASEASKAFGERKKAGLLTPGEKGPKTFRGAAAFTENGKLTGKTVDPESGEIVVGRPQIIDVKPASWTPPSNTIKR